MPRKPFYSAGKRLIDVLGAALLLAVVAPLLLVVVLLIRRQDAQAPIFFRQARTGLGGRRFEVLKFRTMVRDADAVKERYRHLSVVPWPDFRMPNDPRVTGLGRFLRKSSLDELPQLVNVLRGDMSLVGPRPTSFDSSTYDLWQTSRLDFRPGLTGPWQVWGRNTMDFDDRCRLEIRFFRDPSLVREIQLLVLTIAVVFRRTGVA